jgi:hypothetical protein
MNDFTFYFQLGWKHIISPDAMDHLLFIAALTAIYLFQNGKQVLILVTAFTIGHSVTLALSTYDLIRFNSHWVEFLIPLTILITCLFNFFQKEVKPRSLQLNYFLALFFGLEHGMGFANSIRFMLAKSQTIFVPLLGFNLGLEAGQLVVVAFILLVAFLLVTKLRLSRRIWVVGLSGVAAMIAIIICIERWPI